jgi:hypothetical protein
MKYFEKNAEIQNVVETLAKLVSKKNQLGKGLQSAKQNYNQLKETAKVNEIFTQWGRKTYKGKDNWDPKTILTELKKRRAIVKDKQIAHDALGDIKYKHPQEVYKVL